MSKLRQRDMILELIELCHEIQGEISQQLLYYRASVYKTETAGQISQRIEQLRVVFKVLISEDLDELMKDYDALAALSSQMAPGECALTRRVTELTKRLQPILAVMQRRAMHPNNDLPQVLRNASQYRKALLSICKPGSRPWQILQQL
jgi:hypothetical protein